MRSRQAWIAGGFGWMVAAWMVSAAVAEPAAGGNQFRRALESLVQADRARESGQVKAAFESYTNSLAAYEDIQRRFPSEEAELVRFRVVYCREQANAITSYVPATVPVSVAGPGPGAVTNSAMRAGDGEKVAVAPAELEAVLEGAAALLEKGEGATAKKMLIPVAGQTGEDARARMMLAVAHCQAGEFENAIFVLEGLIKEKKGGAEAWVVTASAQAGMGELKAASDSLLQAIRTDRTCLAAYYNMTVLLTGVWPGEEKVAGEYYRRYRALGGLPDREFEAKYGGGEGKKGDARK